MSDDVITLKRQAEGTVVYHYETSLGPEGRDPKGVPDLSSRIRRVGCVDRTILDSFVPSLT